MDDRVSLQTEATTVRVPRYDRDDDQKYALEAIFLELAAYIRRRHGRDEHRAFTRALNDQFSTPRPNHYEHMCSILEARMNLEIQETIRELTSVANTYHPPLRPLSQQR
jgi:hypothetical protein